MLAPVTDSELAFVETIKISELATLERIWQTAAGRLEALTLQLHEFMSLPENDKTEDILKTYFQAIEIASKQVTQLTDMLGKRLDEGPTPATVVITDPLTDDSANDPVLVENSSEPPQGTSTPTPPHWTESNPDSATSELAIHFFTEPELPPLTSGQLRALLQSSYNRDLTDVVSEGDTFLIDKSLSGARVKVFSRGGKAFVVHRGTQGFWDVATDAALFFGATSNARWRHARTVQREAEEKYGRSNVTTLGHSLGGAIAERVGSGSSSVITYNAPTTLGDLNSAPAVDVHTRLRTSGDVVSMLAPWRAKSGTNITIDSRTGDVLLEHALEAIPDDLDMSVGAINTSWASDAIDDAPIAARRPRKLPIPTRRPHPQLDPYDSNVVVSPGPVPVGAPPHVVRAYNGHYAYNKFKGELSLYMKDILEGKRLVISRGGSLLPTLEMMDKYCAMRRNKLTPEQFFRGHYETFQTAYDEIKNITTEHKLFVMESVPADLQTTEEPPGQT